MKAIIASLDNEENWQRAQAESVWGFRQGNKGAATRASTLRVDDRILFYRGGKAAAATKAQTGVIAMRAAN